MGMSVRWERRNGARMAGASYRGIGTDMSGFGTRQVGNACGTFANPSPPAELPTGAIARRGAPTRKGLPPAAVRATGTQVLSTHREGVVAGSFVAACVTLSMVFVAPGTDHPEERLGETIGAVLAQTVEAIEAGAFRCARIRNQWLSVPQTPPERRATHPQALTGVSQKKKTSGPKRIFFVR